MATIYNSTHTGQQIDNILNMIYPVGSIYLSVNNVDTSTLFGGSWERIEGKFLLASSSTHAIGTTGGEESHSLTQGELPVVAAYGPMGLYWAQMKFLILEELHNQNLMEMVSIFIQQNGKMELMVDAQDGYIFNLVMMKLITICHLIYQ